MILFLRVLFLAVLVSMLWVTGWASLQCPLFAVPREVRVLAPAAEDRTLVVPKETRSIDA